MRSLLPKTVTSSPAARPARTLPSARVAKVSSKIAIEIAATSATTSATTIVTKKKDTAVAAMVRRGTTTMSTALSGGRRGPHARRLPDASPAARIPVESRIVLRGGGVTFR
jgi:hypothetical protein